MPSATPRRRGRPPADDHRLLAVAERHFARRGFASTDLGEVAKAAGLGKGSVYRRFASKQALFLACVRHALDGLLAAVDAVPADDDPRREAQAVAATYLRYFAAHPDTVTLMLMERTALPGRARQTYFDLFEQRADEWRELAGRLIAQGRHFRLPFAQAHRAAGDAIYGLMLGNWLRREWPDPDRQAAEFTELLFDGLLLPEDAR